MYIKMVLYSFRNGTRDEREHYPTEIVEDPKIDIGYFSFWEYE